MYFVHGYLSIVIALVSLLSIFTAIAIVKSIIGIQIFTISSYFIANYVVFVLLGSVILNFHLPEYHQNIGIQSRPDFLLMIWGYSLIGLYLILAGMVLANIVKLEQSPKSNLYKIFKNELSFREISEKKLYNISLFILLVCLLVLILYRSVIGGYFPVESLFSGLSASDLRVLRSDATNNFQGKFYQYSVFLKELPTFLVTTLYFAKRRSKRLHLLFLIATLFLTFTSILDFQKAPLVNMIILYYLLSSNTKQVRWKDMLMIFAIVITLAYFMSVFFMANDHLSPVEVIQSISDRIFIGGILPFYYWQQYQEQFGFLGGRSFLNPGGIFPFEYVRIDVEIWKYSGLLDDNSIIGTMPTVFFANWWINFGMIAAFMSMIVFGFIIRLLDIIIIRKLAAHKTLYLLSFFVFLMMFFSQYVGTSVDGIIIDFRLYVCGLTALIFSIFTKEENIKKS